MTGTPSANSAFAAGSVTAPLDGAAIATIAATSLPAGLWHVLVVVEYGATAGADNGMRVQAGGTTLWTIQLDATAATNAATNWEFARILDGSTALTVNAAGAGPVGSVYKATIIATPIRS